MLLIRSSTSLALLALIALAGIGCAEDGADDLPDPPDGPDAGTEAWIELGTGGDFRVLDDGSQVEIVMGPQGGYMLHLALRGGGITPGDPGDPAAPENPRATFRALLMGASPTVVGTITYQRGMDFVVGASEWELQDAWLVFAFDVATDLFFDRELMIEVRFVDASGAELQDRVRVFAAAP